MAAQSCLFSSIDSPNGVLTDDDNAAGMALYELIWAGLASEQVFPSISLRSIAETQVTSLQRVQRDPGIKALSAIFAAAGLGPRLGFNMGSLDISLTLTIPLFGSQGPATPATAIVWTMLGLNFAHCEWLESKYARDGAEREGAAAGGKQGAAAKLLSNRCLDFFMQQTQVAIVSKRNNFRLGHLTVGVESVARGVQRVKDGQRFTDRDNLPFKYSPAYRYLNGFSPELGHCSEPALEVQQQVLVGRMLDDFWQIVGDHRYFPDEALREEVTNMLAAYFYAGIQGESEGFLTATTQPLSIYLHGQAGIGKSQFVKVFTSSLRELLRRYVDPDKRVDVVRVPLNSITPANFRRILLVQGISDWSIERILEQTVCKGGIVILHLEENPDDFEMQVRLFDLTQALLDSIVTRYPEYRGNIIYVFTSNYPAAPTIEGLTRALVHVQPPNPSTQREWCVRALQHAIASYMKSYTDAGISVRLNIDPPHGDDMRRLETYHMSLAFLTAYQLRRHKHLHKSAVQISIDPLPCPPEDLSDVSVAKWLSISFDDPDIPLLPVCSHDLFFFFNPEVQRNLHLTTHLADMETVYRPTVASLVDMVTHSFLKPAVIVLIGDSDARRSYSEMLSAYLHAQVNGKLSTTTIYAETEEHKAEIFGDPQSPSLGGLFKFIDSVTNPVYALDDHYAFVTAHVNELGQFMLRELLETDASRTHRNRILKDRTIFTLSLVDGSELSPQLQSRAHAIIHC